MDLCDLPTNPHARAWVKEILDVCGIPCIAPLPNEWTIMHNKAYFDELYTKMILMPDTRVDYENDVFDTTTSDYLLFADVSRTKGPQRNRRADKPAVHIPRIALYLERIFTGDAQS